MAEIAPPPSGHGSVLLDIGGDIGALVLYTPASFLGREIEIEPADHREGFPHTHTAVRERQVGEAPIFAAVYPSLPSGSYVLEGRPEPVAIVGGRITEVEW